MYIILSHKKLSIPLMKNKKSPKLHLCLGKNSEADAYDAKNNFLLFAEQVDKDCDSLYMYHKFN